MNFLESCINRTNAVGKIVPYPLSISYLAAEIVQRLRQFEYLELKDHGFFNGISSTTASYAVSHLALQAAMIHSERNEEPSSPHATIKGRCVSALAGTACAVIAETPFMEDVGYFSDPKDMIYGVAGAALGAMSASHKHKKEAQAQPTPEVR